MNPRFPLSRAPSGDWYSRVAQRLCGAAGLPLFVQSGYLGETLSNRLSADFVKENLAELMPNPPTITAGHVRAQS